MGYFIKDKKIAKESVSPAKVSLANNPNFIEFEPEENGQKNIRAEWELTVVGKGLNSSKENITAFSITESNSGKEHVFRGTMNPQELNSATFYLGPKGSDDYSTWKLYEIANSLRECLLNDIYLKSNFDISLPFQTDMNGDLLMGTVVRIVSKGFGKKYNFTIVGKEAGFSSSFLKVSRTTPLSSSSDAISEGYGNVEVQLDVYKDTGLFLGENTLADTNSGSFVTTLSKAYLDTAVWFDLNALKQQRHSDAFLTATDWCDAGTVQDYRFVGKRLVGDEKYYTNDVFYYSDVLYSLTGYDRSLEANDLSDYVYDVDADNIMKPLTRQPELNHIKGQRQYFNFILLDKYHSKAANDCLFGISYKLLTQSGRLITQVVQHEKSSKDFAVVNTIGLDIDALLMQYPSTGIVNVCLTRDGRVVSSPLTYNILPSHLYTVRDFAFLNSLGGWSSFNFSESLQTDFKTTGNSYFRNQLPRFTTSDRLESIHYKSAEEIFIAQTMALRHEVADWLKEMSASPAVYELSTGRYIVVDDLGVKHSTKDSQVRLDMKYHYSDSYNSELKA